MTEALRRPEDFVGYGMIRKSAVLAEQFRLALRPFELSPSQFSAMAVLAQGRDRSAAELARAIVMTPQSVGPLLDGLEHRGLLAREGLRGRGRMAMPKLTGEGIALLRGAYEVVERLDQALRTELRDDYDVLALVLQRWGKDSA